MIPGFTDIERVHIRRSLHGRILCSPCGGTLDNWGDRCRAHGAEPCAVSLAIDRARDEAAEMTEADLVTH